MGEVEWKSQVLWKKVKCIISIKEFVSVFYFSWELVDCIVHGFITLKKWWKFHFLKCQHLRICMLCNYVNLKMVKCQNENVRGESIVFQGSCDQKVLCSRALEAGESCWFGLGQTKTVHCSMSVSWNSVMKC